MASTAPPDSTIRDDLQSTHSSLDIPQALKADQTEVGTEERVGNTESGDGTHSRHSSVLGPYRAPMPSTQYPLYHPTTTSAYQAAVFSRSLIQLGHGFAPWRPGTISRPEEHFHQGVSIGDVGWIGDDGGLQYRFNIFYPADHPIQPAILPRTFRPIEPPLSEWEVRSDAGHFPAGTVLSSIGLTMTGISQQPLEIEFKSDAREGAVLILPAGAGREDLVDTQKLHAYVKQHASDWYQFMNGYSDTPVAKPVVNGTLFLVTGTDKAKLFNSALFPREESARRQPTTFRYVAKSISEREWLAPSSVNWASEEITNANGHFPSALFLRGLTIALSKSVWTHGIAPIPIAFLPLYYIPSIPLRGRFSGIIARIKRGPHDEDDVDYDSGEVVFHPAILLLQILLDVIPDADLAIVEDSIWCSLLHDKAVTTSEVTKMVTAIINAYDTKNIEGTAMFVEKLKRSTPFSLRENIQSYIQFLFTGTTLSKSQQQALRKLKKLLSKPDPLPPSPIPT